MTAFRGVRISCASPGEELRALQARSAAGASARWFASLIVRVSCWLATVSSPVRSAKRRSSWRFCSCSRSHDSARSRPPVSTASARGRTTPRPGRLAVLAQRMRRHFHRQQRAVGAAQRGDQAHTAGARRAPSGGCGGLRSLVRTGAGRSGSTDQFDGGRESAQRAGGGVGQHDAPVGPSVTKTASGASARHAPSGASQACLITGQFRTLTHLPASGPRRG